MSEAARIGIYGGTFDPPHTTHLDIARAALQHAHLDKVLFVVAASPPHKSGGVHAAAGDRLAMVEAALLNEREMEVSRVELDRRGTSYTVDTLRELQRSHPHARLFLILGSDSVQDLPRWRQPEQIVALAELLVVQRPGAPAESPPTLDGRSSVVPFQERDVSSTRIRECLARGEDVSGMVPESVLAVIRERGLYRARR
ncbi:MAG: nicotinate (nicotinamide) nucleotide adenylyltransferase [Candidatus Hydrogenedentes bacterium]|nr:nicotinate (nicotinamide) nucleotide adenylyltransferase [Candidatus Hydrogenedentota bacterium]